MIVFVSCGIADPYPLPLLKILFMDTTIPGYTKILVMDLMKTAVQRQKYLIFYSPTGHKFVFDPFKDQMKPNSIAMDQIPGISYQSFIRHEFADSI